MNLFGHSVGLLGRGISPTQGLFLHRTTQHRKTRTHIHAPSRIRTRDPNVRAVEDSAAIGTGCTLISVAKLMCINGTAMLDFVTSHIRKPFIQALYIVLGTTQPPFQWVPGALSLGVKRPGREAHHSPPFSAEVKNAWSYTSTSPIRLHGVVLR
jgi:hypothetical protein